MNEYKRAAGSAHHEKDKKPEENKREIWETIAYVSLAIGIACVILLALYSGGGR